MMKISFKTDDAATHDNPDEVSRVIREVAKEIAQGSTSGTIRDANGNRIGKYALGRG